MSIYSNKWKRNVSMLNHLPVWDCPTSECCMHWIAFNSFNLFFYYICNMSCNLCSLFWTLLPYIANIVTDRYFITAACILHIFSCHFAGSIRSLFVEVNVVSLFVLWEGQCVILLCQFAFNRKNDIVLTFLEFKKLKYFIVLGILLNDLPFTKH